MNVKQIKLKNNFLIFLLSIFGCSLFFAECKKYVEDDVWIQWKRPEKRLVKYGPWVFDKLTVDGVDKSDEFRNDSAYFDNIEFLEHSEYSTDLNINRTLQRDEIGSYSLINKEFLRITALPALPNEGDFHNYGPLFKTTGQDWEILALSKKRLILKTEFNSIEYKIELIPQ